MTSQCLKIVVALALTTVVGTPQAATPSQSNELVIRSIKIIPVATSRKGLPDPGAKLQHALARVPLVVESKFTGQALLGAIDKTEKSIQSVYKDMAGILADSTTDFSGTQGSRNWYYGYFPNGDPHSFTQSWATSGFRYYLGLDVANNVSPGCAAQGHNYDYYAATPRETVWFPFFIQHAYKGTVSDRLPKFNVALQKDAWSGATDEFGHFTIAAVIDQIKRPGNTVLVDVPVTTTNNGGGSYTLSWTVPSAAQSYVVKTGAKRIVNWIGFDAGLNQFTGDPVNTMAWFAANTVANPPAPGAAGTTQQWTVTGMPTSGQFFAVKASVTGAGSSPGSAAPTVSITAPANGATFSGTTSVTATASSSTGMAGVQFQVDGVNLGTMVSGGGPSYSASWDTTKSTNGSHTLSAIAMDTAGSTATSSVPVTVSNAAIPPVISSVAASAVTSSGATITWITDKLSDSQVAYGTTASYGSVSTLGATLVTSHSVVLSGLATSTTYHYKVQLRDALGNLVLSGDFTFTTLGISGTGSTLLWTQTWGQNPESNSQLTGGAGNPPQNWVEPAAYASQSALVVTANKGPFVWEEYHHDIPVFSNAAYFYSWQNGATSYPWGQPVFYCNNTLDTQNSNLVSPTTNSYWILNAPINSTTTTIQANQTIVGDSAAGLPITDADAFYPSTGGPVYIRIDDEILRFVSYDSTNKILTVIRGALGTTAAPHSNTIASATDPNAGRFGYICQHPYVGDGVSLPTQLTQAWPNNVPMTQHPFGGFLYDSTHDLIWILGGAAETFRRRDTFTYCYPGSTSAYCSAHNTPATASTYITSSLLHHEHGAPVWDPDDKVLIFTGGDSGSGQSVQLMCLEANAAAGCTSTNVWNLMTDGTTTTYVSNPSSGPNNLLGMTGIYDTLHHAAIFWGGGLCPLKQSCGSPDWQTTVFILQFSGGKWNWLIPTQKGGDGLACTYGGNCPYSDIHPVFTWDSKRNRMLDVSPVTGTTYSATWDGGNPGMVTWTNLNLSNGPKFNFGYCNGISAPTFEPQGCLDWPYGGYWAAHDAIVMAGAGQATPTSLAAWELDLSGTSDVGGTSCDLNGDGTVNVLDVQLAINQVLGKVPCTTADLQHNGQCNVVDVQHIINASLGKPCVIGP